MKFQESSGREREKAPRTQHFSSPAVFVRQRNDAHLYKTEICKPAVHSLCGISGDISAPSKREKNKLGKCESGKRKLK